MSALDAAVLATVVIMAKQPAPGRTKTRLCPPLSPSEAADLYAAMLDDTIALVATLPDVQLAVAVTPASSLRRWRPVVPPRALVLGVDGANIGACLDTVLTQLLHEHGSPVIALNSDGPTLPPDRIDSAARLLENHDVVIGPGEDGGYYLIGLRGPQPALFADLAWSTPTVAATTVARAAALGLSVAQLEPWYDVDTASDVSRLRTDLERLPGDVARRTRRFFGVRQPVFVVPPVRSGIGVRE